MLRESSSSSFLGGGGIEVKAARALPLLSEDGFSKRRLWIHAALSSHTRLWRLTLTFKGDTSVTAEAADGPPASAAARREIDDEANDAVY